MATRFDQFNVSPSVSGVPALVVPRVDNAAPKQLQQTGQAIQGASVDAQAIYMDQLREANALAVNEAVTSSKEFLLDKTYGPDGYTQLKGRDAMFRPDDKSLVQEYGDQFKQHSQAVRDGLKNEAQKREFDRLSEGMGLGFETDLVKHTAGERHNWFVSNVKGSIEVGQREIALSAGDPEKTDSAVARVKAQVASLAGEMGMSAAEVEAEQFKVLGEAHKLAVQNLIGDDNWEGASNYFDRHREEMDADSQFAINTAINKEADYAIGSAVARDIMQGTLAEGNANAPQQLIPPVSGNFPISGKYGTQRPGHIHGGIDIATPVGTAVAAPAAGVARVRTNAGGYGTMIEIDHGGGLVTRVAHLAGVNIKDGDRVAQGQRIATSGGAKGAAGAGNSQGPHVHYEVRRGGKPVDPGAAYSTPGGGRGAAAGSLTEALRRLDSDPRIGSDPQRRQIAEQAIKEQFQARDYDQRKSEEDARDRAFSWIAANPGKPVSQMPAGIRNSVQGSDLPSVFSFQKGMTEVLTGPGVTAEASAGTYAAARDGISSGKITDINALIPLRPYLTAGDFKQLADDVTAIKKGDQSKIDSTRSTNDAMSLLKTEISAHGITVKDDDEDYQKLKGAAYREIERAERAAGRPLTGDEKRPIVLTLLGKAATQSTGIGAFFGGTKRGYEIDNEKRIMPYSTIPAPVRDAITTSLRRRGIPTDRITRQMIVDEYQQYSRTR